MKTCSQGAGHACREQTLRCHRGHPLFQPVAEHSQTRCIRNLRFSEAVAAGALAFGVQASVNRWTLDGGRTIGWELADALAHPRAEHVFVQVGGGALLASCAAGLIEAVASGRLERAPRIWAVQGEGCAPFDRAWRGITRSGDVDERMRDAQARSSTLMFPWRNPTGAATGILDDETYDWLGVARALLLSSGDSVVATEADIRAANDPRAGGRLRRRRDRHGRLRRAARRGTRRQG